MCVKFLTKYFLLFLYRNQKKNGFLVMLLRLQFIFQNYI